MNIRIKEERKRLGFTQAQLAEKAGLKMNAQSKYERGENEPKASYFVQLDELGADVNYIITGRRIDSDMTHEEHFLVKLFRELDKNKQKKVLAMLLTDDQEPKSEDKQRAVVSLGGIGTFTAGGDITNGE